MPAGNISEVERIQRLKKIKELRREGLKPVEIAEKLGMGLTTVKRNLVMLKELRLSDLTPKDVAEKRNEIDLNLKEIALKAMEKHDYWEDEKPSTARSYLLLAKEAYMDIARIFGLDSTKIDSYTQINQLNQYDTPDKIEREVGRKIADAMKQKHEEG